jgi:hypothetical protein
MKKIIISILALILAFFVAEFILYKIIGYPKRTDSIKYVFLPNVKGFENLKLKEPHTKFWSVEGGNNVFQYNNLSVTGKDVYPDANSKIVFVLGDSFVEAASVSPDSTGVSVFQNELNKLDTNIKAINIGFPNSDPYTLWYRTMFFEKSYKPDYVILLVEHLDLLDLYMKTHPDSLDFSTPENFGSIISESKSEKFFGIFRKRSAVFNLFSLCLSIEKTKKEDTKIPSSENNKDLEKSMRKFRDILIKYKEKFGDKFLLVSLEVNDDKIKIISDVCDSVKINFAHKKLMLPENLWGEYTHFNNKGNKEFGEFLYESFIRFYKKR